MANKVATINIHVPFKGPGNIIRQNAVVFDVYAADGHYKAVPHLNDHERRIVNLPQEIPFDYENGKAVSLHGSFDRNFYTVEDIVQELQKQKLL